MKNDMWRNAIFWVIIAGILVALFSSFNNNSAQAPRKINYSTFLQKVEQNQIDSVEIKGRTFTGKSSSGQKFVTYAPWNDPFVMSSLLKHKVTVSSPPPEKENIFVKMFMSLLPFLLLIGVWIFLMRNMGGGGKGGTFSFGKSKAKLLGEDQVNVTLHDVAGVDEAKEEVGELVDFLSDPSKYEKLGGKIPRGVLMVGPPGTGKTMLARGIAGEAKVPFFSISGSDFVEMFVGVGASRVRDMFEQAKKRAPCIIFIDEIDAVGRHRGAGMGGGHDEREQTLNQLLVEMDGFTGNEGVIVIAATNRPDVLDPALLRPGRFDRQVTVPLPTVKGREHILKVHMRNVPLANDVRPDLIARGTPGFSGAELANLVNEAALFAARNNKKEIGMEELEQAKDKILMGAEKRSMAMGEKEKLLTAYHESGHAIVGLLAPDHDPVYKVSIIPRGQALGVTMYLPDGDQVSQSKEKLESRLASLYGGRLAEELIFGADKVTTGAANDIQVATDIARKMVTKWGLSRKMGPLLYGEDDEQPFVGQSMGKQSSKQISERTAADIDAEIKAVIERNYARAKKSLTDNMDILHAMAQALMKYETIDSAQIEDLMARRSVREPGDWRVSYIDGETDDDGKSSKEQADPQHQHEGRSGQQSGSQTDGKHNNSHDDASEHQSGQDNKNK